MTRTSIFYSNRTQAVRLPKDVAFPDTVQQITILRDGHRRILVPSDAVWDDFFAEAGVDLGPRQQPEATDRESF